MKKNGKINTKQLILLVVVVLFVGYEMLFGGSQQPVAESSTSAGTEQSAEAQESEHFETKPSAEESVEPTAVPAQELLYSEEPQSSEAVASSEDEVISIEEYLYFRNEGLWESHYEKHGIDMGFASMEEYLEAANLVLYNEDTLHKIEKEDGDDVYFLESTGEFVVVSTDGYIRTYFIPDAGIDYFNRQ